MLLREFKGQTIYNELMKDITLQCITVRSIHDNYEAIAKSVIGVGLPPNVTVEALKPNYIKSPPDGMGFIKLPRKKDFILLESTKINEVSILEQCLNEMKSIAKGKTAPRAGAAGGYMLPSENCRSLSKVTMNERLILSRKRSVGMSVTYRNHRGEVKGRNAVYNDIHMTRHNSSSKFKLTLKSVAMQRILVNEMISRLRSFIVLDKENVIPIQTSLFGFLKYDDKRRKMENRFLQYGKSLLEAKLLSWACSTGEMRNHEAVKAHFDGNKSHPVETMTVYGRLAVNRREFKVSEVTTMEKGYLLLPLEGITIQMKCGYDILHCSLKNTLHLADNSRNTCNWTRVHGP